MRKSLKKRNSAIILSIFAVLMVGIFSFSERFVRLVEAHNPIPYSIDWSNINLITVDNTWIVSDELGIRGYSGADTPVVPGTDARTVLAESLIFDVDANKANPNTLIEGGVAEFEIANPAIALKGSDTAHAPYINVLVESPNFTNIRFRCNVRDLDSTANDAVQQVALQFRYRDDETGPFTDVPAAYIADATDPGTATRVTPIDVILPSLADDRMSLEIRVLTVNAAGNDEWIAIDDIMVTGVPATPTPTPTPTATPTPTPTLGTYANTVVGLSDNITITPNAAPTNITSINVSAPTSFVGRLDADPVTGVVRVTNAALANILAGTYPVTVRAFGPGGTATAVFNLTVNNAPVCPTLTFNPAANFGVGTSARSLAVGDFNGDGNQDIAVTNANSNNISILIGNGAGSFAAAVNFGVGTFPISVAISDFNGDGNQDIATANLNSNNVSILIGNGAGSFAAAVNFGVAVNPISVAVGDFNGDGSRDIATSNGGSNNVSILTGNGAGSFAAAVNFGVGINPSSIAVGDFNGDGNQDIATANRDSNNVSVLIGNGLGSFAAAANFVAGTGPFSIAVGDFNGDGNQDIATANRTSNDVSILIGNGAGSYAAAVNFGVGTGPASIAVGDFNGDGNQDIAAANSGSNNVSAITGNGMGSFAAAVNFAVGTGPSSIAVGDFDGDGNQDISTANFTSNNVSILQRVCINTPPTFTPAAAISRQQGSPAGAAVPVGTVADAETAGGSLTVTQIGGGTATGITVSGIVNSNGMVTAMVSASCTATAGTVRFQVSDGSLTGTGDLQVNVSPNPPPVLTYGSASVANGGSTTISPATGPNDNGSVASIIVQSVGTYTGIISVNGAGVVSISNAGLIGSHTITIRATDNCGGAGGTTDASFTLNVLNNNPSITPAAAVTRQQGSAGTISPIATVSDLDQSAGSLVVTATTVPTGITVTGITNTAGAVTATVTALCSAATGANTVVLTVSDSNGGSATANFTINVTANTPPTLTYNNASVANFGSTTVSTATAGDNGSITGYNVVSVVPALNTPPTVNASGVVSITNAGPIGSHVITIQATDNCGATTNASFTLAVTNNNPSITAAAAVTRQQGSAGTVSPLATVSDLDQTAGSLVVTATTVPTGITVTGITNTAGAVAATVTALCGAAIGANTVVLTVNDSNGGSATANFTINVTANTAPVLTYGAAAAAFGGSVIISPVTGPSDNGGVSTIVVQSQGTYSGTISVNNTTGVVSVSNAAPVGVHTITIRSTDNCGLATDSSFTLNVNRADTTTTVASSLNPSTYGQSVTFTATVVAGPVVPAGTVNFLDNGNPIAVCQNVALNGSGVAACTTSLLNAGVHTISAVYSGNANFNTSTGTVVQTVNKAVLTVTADNMTRVYGAVNPALTATFTGFVLGETLPTSGVTGSPSLTTLATPGSSVSGSPYTITAATGSLQANNYSFTFVNGQLTVTKAVLTVTANSFTRVFGAPNPVLTAVFTGFVNGEVFATSGVTGTPSLTTTATAASVPGTYPVTAAIGTLAAVNYSFAFVNGTLTVTQAATTTTITNAAALVNVTMVGQSYAVTWTTSPVAPSAGTPTGTVTVTDGTGPGSASCTAAVASGTCTLTSTTPGVKTITATYPGDTNFTGSVSQSVPHTVVIAVTGNIKQFVPFGVNTNLAGVTVTLSGTTAGEVFTDANGNYSFGLLTAGGNIVITPTGLGKTYEPISQTYTNVTTNIANADFIAYNAPGPGGNPRQLSVVNSVTNPGQPVMVPVSMTVQGNETRMAFSLSYDIALLGIPTAVCGAGAPGCAITVNNSLPGKVGITVMPAVQIAAGTREIVNLTFPTFVSTALSTPVSFGDIPVARDIRDAGNNPLPALYSTGFVAFTQGTGGLEGDVVDGVGSPAGGDGVRSNDVTRVRQFVLGTAAVNTTTNQFQRADTSPRDTVLGTYGDGRIDASDVTVARLYNLGNLPPTTAAGPTVPVATFAEMPAPSNPFAPEVGRTIRAANVAGVRGQTVTVSFELDSQGDESSTSFTINFNPAVLSNPVAALGTGVPANSSLNTNPNEVAMGRLGVLVDSTNTYAAGIRQILTVTFNVLVNAPSGQYPVSFSSTPTIQSVSNANGVLLATTYEAGSVAVGASAAGVTVSGRVTTPTGQGLRNATVVLTDSEGNRRTVTTSSFGVYRFEDVEVGQTYVIGVSARRYRFASRAVNVADSLIGVDFIGLE